jgi:hypothetical protein
MVSVNESFSVVGQYRPCPDVWEGKYTFNTRSVDASRSLLQAEMSRPRVGKTGKHTAEMRALC